MTHLTREELDRWWQGDAPAERERIVGHLALCDACGALYGAIVDAQPIPAVPAPPADPGLVARAAGARRPPRRGWPLVASPGALAAAAAVLIALLATPGLRERGPAPDGIRGTSLQPLAPIGATDSPVEFRWTSPLQAAGYRVAVRDGERRLVFELFSATDSARLPADRLRQLAPGESYWWDVVALGADGEEIMRAPARSFFVSSGPR
jgi:hypothetical protein